MFLDHIQLRIENNNSYLGKTVLQLLSQIGQKIVKLVQKMTLKKCSKNRKNQKAENMIA